MKRHNIYQINLGSCINYNICLQTVSLRGFRTLKCTRRPGNKPEKVLTCQAVTTHDNSRVPQRMALHYSSIACVTLLVCHCLSININSLHYKIRLKAKIYRLTDRQITKSQEPQTECNEHWHTASTEKFNLVRDPYS